MIKPEHINKRDLSAIGNVILFGETGTSGDDELYRIGLRITKEVSHNYKPTYKTIDGKKREVPIDERSDPSGAG